MASCTRLYQQANGDDSAIKLDLAPGTAHHAVLLGATNGLVQISTADGAVGWVPHGPGMGSRLSRPFRPPLNDRRML